MKHIFLNLAICLGLVAPIAHAKSFFQDAKQKVGSEFDKAKQTTESAWKKTKETAKSGYQKTSAKFADLHNKALRSWEGINPETKAQIKKALIAAGAIAGTAVVAGAGYAAYSNKSETQGAMGRFEDKEMLDRLVTFLSTDPRYKDDEWAQLTFLEQFDMPFDNRINIIDMVEYEQKQPR